MISFKNIATVSTFERKTLFRSWFFRIFAILAVIILFSLDMGFFGSHQGAHWTTRAIAANLPYINVLFINVAQAVIAVFLASEFLKRDKKLDTMEVIYTRPISNGEYVLGKTLGILTLFISLVLASLLMALIFNLVSKDTPVVWEAYLYYPLLITLPTLIFILGLSFFLMILFRSQAVTFVVLLGYIGLTIFYFKDKLNGLLDYMAFNLPMVYSDFIHFADLENILLHRLAYLLMGIGFIFATIRFLGRLPQNGRWNTVNLFAFILFFSAGLFMAYRYYDNYSHQKNQRKTFLALNNAYADKPAVDVLSNNLHLEQNGEKLKISSEITFRNAGPNRLDTLIFSLNPGFKLERITSKGLDLAFSREQQIIQIIPPEPVKAGRRGRINMHYSGKPDESLAYLDINYNKIASLKKILVATIDKKAGIVKNNFLLMTPDLLWYPIAGVGFNNQSFHSQQSDFVRFSLHVKPNDNLVAVAPGKVEQDSTMFHFTPESDLNALSLVIGPYEKRTIEVDGIPFNIFIKPGHDFFSEYFTEVSDTIPHLIKEAKENYEYDELDLYYDFQRINIVEVPIQFHAYERPYQETVGFIQPEMILMPEKGAGLRSLDFARMTFRENRSRGNEKDTRSPEQKRIDIFKKFMAWTFFGSDIQGGSSENWQRRREALFDYHGELNYTRNPYCVFPLYYSYLASISSSDYPLFNSMVEIYLKEGFEVSPKQNFNGGISDNERANLALKENSLTEIFSKNRNWLSKSLISQAGSFIILALKNRVGSSEFDKFLYYYIEDHAFQEISFDTFARDFEEEFGMDIRPYFKTISTSGSIATFVFSSPEFLKTRDEIGEVYLVKYKITNIGDAKGMIDITFRMPGQGGFGGGGKGMNTEQRLYEFDPGITRDIQVTLYDMPRIATINTLISGNIPSSFSTFLRSATPSRVSDLEEYEHISDVPVSIKREGEIIVDNEDEGFSHYSVNNASKLKQYIDSRKEESEKLRYTSINPYRSPSAWTAAAHNGFFGESIRSGMVTARGEGTNKVKWKTLLPEAGFYDISVYIPQSAMLARPEQGRGRRVQEGGNPQGQSGKGRGPVFADQGYEYHYTISSSAGSEELIFPLVNIEQGWNTLGSFYFPADTATVSLSNETNGKRVFADAVKWVLKP